MGPAASHPLEQMFKLQGVRSCCMMQIQGVSFSTQAIFFKQKNATSQFHILEQFPVLSIFQNCGVLLCYNLTLLTACFTHG